MPNLISASGISPGVSAAEIVRLAEANIGASWTKNGCALFTWSISNLAGLPFFSTTSYLTISSNPLSIDDPALGIAVPHSPGFGSGTDNLGGDGWIPAPNTNPISGMNSVALLRQNLQPGDIVRVYKAGDVSEATFDLNGKAAAHSFIVESVNGNNIQVIDNWGSTQIVSHSFDDIVNSFSLNGYFQSAFISRIDTAWVSDPVNFDSSNNKGNGYGVFTNIDTGPINSPPTVGGPSSFSVSANQSISAQTLFSQSGITWSDSDGQVTSIRINDAITGQGHFVYQGQSLEGLSNIDVPISNLNQLSYVTDSTVGSNSFSIQAVDNSGALSLQHIFTANVIGAQLTTTINLGKTVGGLANDGFNEYAYNAHDLLTYTYVSESSTQLLLYNDTGNYTLITGTGFTYDAKGYPTGGVVTNYELVSLGVEEINMTGGNISGLALYQAAAGSNNYQFNSLLAGGNDTINGTALNDIIVGGSNAGNDTINGFAGDDYLFGGLGNDIIYGGDGNDLVSGDAGADTMNGGAGNNTLYYVSSAAGVTINLFAGTGSGGDAQGDTFVNFQNVDGSNFNDTIYGDNNANVIYEAAGNNVLFGYGGNDTIIGGAGNDLIGGGTGADYMDGGAGNNTLYYVGSAAGVTINLFAGTGSGGDAQGDSFVNFQNIYLPNFDSTAYGDNTANTIVGGSGNDLLFGYGSNDVIVGGAGNDLIGGGAGADYMDGGTGFNTLYYADSSAAVTINFFAGTGTGGDAQGDTLLNFQGIIGSAFNDILIGDNNANYINGGAGNDFIVGYGGNDYLVGGAGNDLFAYTAAGFGHDEVADFTIGQDHFYIATSLVANFSALTLTASGANTIITIGGDSIQIDGLTPAQLHASDFIFC